MPRVRMQLVVRRRQPQQQNIIKVELNKWDRGRGKNMQLNCAAVNSVGQKSMA